MTGTQPTVPALCIVGHGTRSVAGTGECLTLAVRVRALAAAAAVTAGLDVEVGFLEAASPPFSVAAADLVARGHRQVVCVPLVLFGAGHAKGDIPASIARARRDLPGVRFTYGRHLGVHPELLAVVDDRLAAAVAPSARPDTAVLLVGRGSSDPDANADLHKVARLLWEGRPYPVVEVAFAGITEPRVPEGLSRLLRLGARRIVVVPYFLFTGILPTRVREQAREFAAAHPRVALTVTGHLGADERVAALVLARYREALTGDVRMSCDTCVHRSPMVGFHDRVHQPQVEHHHPADLATPRATSQAPSAVARGG